MAHSARREKEKGAGRRVKVAGFGRLPKGQVQEVEMTEYQMRAKAILRKGIQADQEIQFALFRQEEIRNMAQGCGANNITDRVQTSPKQDSMETAISLLQDEYRRFSVRVAEWMEVKKEIWEQLDRMENPQYRQLLIMRYVYRLRLEDIALKMGYALSHVKRMHRNALDDFGRLDTK